ncbi:MAG: PAS domain-containing protein [Oscillospiraceae bacterium]|nr:PAS domain-containing protein [Oscillospiraceae bacterium]
MKSKIFGAIISVALAVILLCSGFLTVILYGHFNNSVYDELKNQAFFISHAIAENDSYLESIASSDNRITIVNADGTVAFDSRSNPAEMDNHYEREEIIEAFENGEGISSRYSDTLDTQTLYYAQKMSDGRVIRISAEVESVNDLVLAVMKPMLIVLFMAVVSAFLISREISDHIVNPINDIDLNDSELIEPYEELAPLVQKIRAQNSHINKQMSELKRRQNEFNIMTENMSEGVLLIDSRTEILSYNPAALRLLGVTKEDAENSRSILEINRSESFIKAVENALDGKHSELSLESDDKTYHIAANPVLNGENVSGVIIIILDVTETEKREQLRREFTSNVSHELKTPLTTIYGISDMLCGGIVKPEDVNGFAENIRSEAQRMITLIDDIIKLSHLDEGGKDIEKSEVDLLAVAENVAERLKYPAEKSGISITVNGKRTVVNGAPAIIEEMMFNLADNAVKYNRENGSVTITVNENNSGKYFSVKDTGIGIPAEAQERVFERFYRIDKSHSKKIGGTGLGLSIVKHGAAFHNAEIQMNSTVNTGTEITVRF